MNRSLAALVLLVAGTAGCSSGGSGPAPATATVHDTQSNSASVGGDSWTMPDLTGRNLQEAQNAIQALTANKVFYTGSTDLTGRGRAQVMDRNWRVCTSTPVAGATFTKDTAVDFGVVRIDGESCP